MAQGVGKIYDALRARINEKTRDRREFKNRQKAIYNEGLIQFKLKEQLTNEVRKMDEDPSITSIRVRILPNAMPFLSSVVDMLDCKVQECSTPGELLLIKVEEYL